MNDSIHKSHIEIMSPAGSFEAIDAAIKAGAGSVYFGVGQMNMRAAMKVSFSVEDLPAIAEKCQENGLKSYLALNIVIYDEELEGAKQLVDKAKDCNISAIIASDHAIINYCFNVGVNVHISTQANISNIEEVAYFAKFANAMVLGRELSLEQISNIVKKIKGRGIKGPSGDLVRIEIFIHGYFCMAISGKCYLSLDSYNSSANRGECVAPCQRKYIVKDATDGTELLIDNENIMSAKDLCTIDFIDKIIETGASVLKIEGRKKSVDYVYVTTKCYKEAVDAYFDGTYSTEKINDLKLQLSAVFNRGFWSGYYLGKKIEEEQWDCEPVSRIIKKKTFVASGLHYLSTEERGVFKLRQGKIKEGDKLVIVDPSEGLVHVEAEDIWIDDKKSHTVKRGHEFSLPVPIKISVSAKMYKITYDKDNFLVSLASNRLKSLIGNRAYEKLRMIMKR